MISEFDFQTIQSFSPGIFSDVSMLTDGVVRNNVDGLPIQNFVKDFEQNGEVKKHINQFRAYFNLDELNIISFVLLKKFVHFID